MTEDAGDIRFRNAITLAGVFKMLAVLVLAFAVIAAIAGGVDLARKTDSSGVHVYTGGTVAVLVTGDLLGGIVVASFLGFFGYVLELLVELYTQAWNIRYEAEEAEA